MEKYTTEILDRQILEVFCKSFVNKLGQYKLSYYLRDRNNNISSENAIHASIIWTRKAVEQINKSKTIIGSKNIDDLIVLISYIDILLEATEQVYRVLYKSKNGPDCNQEEFCFRDIPEEYNNLNNRRYFKEIRALFSAHPVNIKSPSGKKRFADIPSSKGEFFELANLKGDFNVRLWTATINDEDTIRFPLYVEDLVKYLKIIYSRYEDYSKRVIDIANKHVK